MKNRRKLIRGFLPLFSETVRWLLNGVGVSRAIVSLHHAPPAFKDRPTVLCGLFSSRVTTLKRTFCGCHCFLLCRRFVWPWAGAGTGLGNQLDRLGGFGDRLGLTDQLH